MKRRSTVMILFGVLVSVIFMGFQCGSPEFTGAKVYIQQKNYKEAIRLLEIEVQKNPNNIEAWWFLGSLKNDQFDYEGMNYAFNSVKKLTNKYDRDIYGIRYNRWAGHLNSGVDLLNRASSDSTQYYEKAIYQFQRAVAAWPDTGLTYRYIGYVFNNSNQPDSAVIFFQIAWDKSKDLESLKRIARIHLNKGLKFKQTFEEENSGEIANKKKVSEFNKNMKKDDVLRLFGPADNVAKPEEPKTKKQKAAAPSTKEVWSYTKFNLTIEFDGEQITKFQFKTPYVPNIDSTKYFSAMEHFDKAVQTLLVVKKSAPNDNESLNLLMQAYVESNRLDEAINAFAFAVQNDPKNKLNRYILGVLFRSAGRFAEAAEEFKKAIELDPEYIDAYYDLGATYYNWGVDLVRQAQEKNESSPEGKEKFRTALPYIEKVIQARPKEPQLWETLGTIYAQIGETDKAAKAFEKAEKLRKGEE